MQVSDTAPRNVLMESSMPRAVMIFNDSANALRLAARRESLTPPIGKREGIPLAANSLFGGGWLMWSGPLWVVCDVAGANAEVRVEDWPLLFMVAAP